MPNFQRRKERAEQELDGASASSEGAAAARSAGGGGSAALVKTLKSEAIDIDDADDVSKLLRLTLPFKPCPSAASQVWRGALQAIGEQVCQ